MATYIQGLTQYLPQIQPFQRDFNFFANVMQKKQTEYDSGHQAMNKLYGSIFYSDVSRADNQEKKEEILKSIDYNLRKVSGLDLSLDENVRQAKQVFKPFYEDQNLMKDISYTKTYQNAVQKGLSAKDCVGKDCPDVYWDGGLRLLNHQMKNFKNASADRAMQMRNPTYVNKFNMMKEAAKAAKENNFEIVFEGPKNGYMVKEKNGPNAIAPLSDFLYQMFGDDARAIDYYGAKAQLNFYENPEETINQYELQKMRSRAKDAEDYKNMIEEKSKRQTFEKNKRVITTAENNTRSELHEVKDRRKTFQDYATEMGEAFKASPAKQAYDETLQEENVKQRTYENIKGLSDNVRNINYFDEEGNPVAEDVIVGVVAQGMMIDDISNSAKVIANNTYEQTVKGPDPYAMARYKNQLQVGLANYKNELKKDYARFEANNELVNDLIGGKGKSKKEGKKTTDPVELTKQEEAKIRKEASDKLKEEQGNVADEDLKIAEDNAVEQARADKKNKSKLEKAQEFKDKEKEIIEAFESGDLTKEQANKLNEVMQETFEDIGEDEEGNLILLAPTTIDKKDAINTYEKKDIPKNITNISALEAMSSDEDEISYTDEEGTLQNIELTFSDMKNAIDNQSIQNAGIILKFNKNLNENTNYIGSVIGKTVYDSLKSEDPSVVAAANQVLRGVGVDPNAYTNNADDLEDAIVDVINNNPEKFNDYFLGNVVISDRAEEMFNKYRDETPTDIINKYINKTSTEVIKTNTYKGVTLPKNHNPFTLLTVGKKLGISNETVTRLKIQEDLKQKVSTLYENYDNKINDALEYGALSRHNKNTNEAKNTYDALDESPNTYLMDNYPTMTQYIKAGEKLVKQTVPSTFKSQFSRFLRDESKNNYENLKKYHEDNPDVLSGVSSTSVNIQYFEKISDFKETYKESFNEDFNFSFAEIIRLDKAGLLSAGIPSWIGPAGAPREKEPRPIFKKNKETDDYELTPEAIAGGIKFDNETKKLDLSNIFISASLKNIIPSLEQNKKRQINIVEDLQEVKGFTSKGMYSGTDADSDFGFHSFGMTATTNLSNYNIDEIDNLRDALNLGKKLFNQKSNGIPIIPDLNDDKKIGNTRAVVQVKDEDVYRNGTKEEQETYLDLYEDLTSLEFSETMDKLDTNAPKIKQTLITESGAYGYGFLEIELDDKGDSYKKYKVISEDLYKSLSKDKKKKIKDDGIKILPKIRIHIPQNEYQPFIKANKSIAFNTFKANDKIGDLDTFDAEIKIENINSEKITYSTLYNKYYRDSNTDEIKLKVVEIEGSEYPANAEEDYMSIITKLILTGQALSKQSLKEVNSDDQ